MSEVLQDVLRAEEHFAPLLAQLEAEFLIRARQREKMGIKVVAFVGHSGSGKDEAAGRFASYTDAKYDQALSRFVSPFIAWCRGVDEEENFRTRHEHCMYWKAWCDCLRRDDPSRLCRLFLGRADIVVGIRGGPELYAVMDNGLVDLVVWINRPGVPKDPTMDYNETDIFAFANSWHWICNDGDLQQLDSHVKRMAEELSMFVS